MNTAGRDLEVTWWRECDREVDFVLSGPGGVLAIVVPSARSLLVGAQGLPLEEILSRPASDLFV